MLNLYNELSNLDKERIKNYIIKYSGATEKNYLGNEEYLKYWTKCKPHLYHLLGGNLIYKFPISIKKPSAILDEELCQLIQLPFCKHFQKKSSLAATELNKGAYYQEMVAINRYISFLTFSEKATRETVKFQIPSKLKMLQIQKGTKILRALRKVIDYLEWEDLRSEFKDFSIKYSQVFNDDKLKGNLCISIHPLDFMTMSDNSLGWNSCMSWVKKGCYRQGTVEMMNSNNVVCCYLESQEPYYFGEVEVEEWKWNNKKWRQLFYITKEIAVCGKAYPYQNKELSQIILKKIKELSENNLRRTYTFGIEPYRDMKHIGSITRMENHKDWIQYKNTLKHNIIFDTKAMYNDMFNDHDGFEDIYWCYRNKVKKNTVISYSGKGICACCGDNLLEEGDFDERSEGAYNNRYTSTSALLCNSCRNLKRCSSCYDDNYVGTPIRIDERIYCPTCAERYIKKCPSCGKPFHFAPYESKFFIRKTETRDFYIQDFKKENFSQEKVEPIFLCLSCEQKIESEFITVKVKYDKNKIRYSWLEQIEETKKVSKEIFSNIANSKWTKFLENNLKTPNLEELEA